MSNTTCGMLYQFSAITTIDWTLNQDDLRQLGDDIEQIINLWLENATIVEDGAEIPVKNRQEMLRVITDFMCSDKFEWSER